jgi:hypothetical protein|tara:strand:+ start:844 stop:1242 length:399 start_codon:yes stop_codon:yes gene_type:complete
MTVGKNREALRELRSAHPEWTQYVLVEELEKVTGEKITVQRVGQILKRDALATRHYKEKSLVACALCEKPTEGTKLHPACRVGYYYETVRCRICDKPRVMLKSMVKRMRTKGQQNFYCTRDHFLVGKGRGFS